MEKNYVELLNQNKIKNENDKADFLELFSLTNSQINDIFFGLIKFSPSCKKCLNSENFQLDNFIIYSLENFNKPNYYDTLKENLFKCEKLICKCKRKFEHEIIRLPKILLIWFEENDLYINEKYFEDMTFEIDKDGFVSQNQKGSFYSLFIFNFN